MVIDRNEPKSNETYENNNTNENNKKKTWKNIFESTWYQNFKKPREKYSLIKSK